MVQEISTPKTTAIAPETVEFFGGDELRIRCFLDKYALRDLSGRIIEKTPLEMWARVAREIASVETDSKKRREWEKKFSWLLEDFRLERGSPDAPRFSIASPQAHRSGHARALNLLSRSRWARRSSPIAIASAPSPTR